MAPCGATPTCPTRSSAHAERDLAQIDRAISLGEQEGVSRQRALEMSDDVVRVFLKAHRP